MAKRKIYTMSFAKVYPQSISKAEKKGRKKSEVDEIICWLTGYRQEELEVQIEKQTDFETFFGEAPQLNLSRSLIKSVICGVRVENIEESMMQLKVIYNIKMGCMKKQKYDIINLTT